LTPEALEGALIVSLQEAFKIRLQNEYVISAGDGHAGFKKINR
jgi:hypothetical protein